MSWLTFYFDTTIGFDLAWWGRIYDAGHHGTWVNSIDGNGGDITDSMSAAAHTVLTHRDW